MILTEMTVAVTRARMRRAEASGYEGSIVQVATPAVAIDGGRSWRMQGFTGRGRNVKWHFGHPPPPGLYKLVCGSRKVCLPILAIFG